MTLDNVQYTATTHTTGGRDGTALSDDGRLDVALAHVLGPMGHVFLSFSPCESMAVGANRKSTVRCSWKAAMDQSYGYTAAGCLRQGAVACTLAPQRAQAADTLGGK